MADHSTTNGTSQQQIKLAALLRECANYVERNEFHPDLYQALGQLHKYTGEHSGNTQGSVGSSVDDRDISPKTSGSFDQQAHQVMHSLGKKFTKGLGLTPMGKPVTQSHAHGTSQKNADRVKADLEAFHGKPKAEVGHRSKENDWCDEHFCLGCQCKTHQQPEQQATATTATPLKTSAAAASAATEPRSSSISPTPLDTARREARPETTPRATVTTSTPTTTPRPSKPAFQRPVNPSSILIANGWIEQQRRSKMRIVWKYVLASLVEGRKPGEETTLWIQRETHNAVTGKAELEALHQIPLKWLTSVDYMEYSTDHRFALKVHNVPEEFLFRCASEEAAQNWVLTLRSVREVTMKNSKAVKKEEAPPPQESQPSQPESTSHRMTISELRAIAHGAGISTVGMERRELEEAVAKLAGGAQSDTAKEEVRREEELRKRREAMDEQRRRGEAVAALEEKRRKQQALEEAEARQRLAEATERRKRAAAEESERRMRAEEERIRLAEQQAAEQRRKLAEQKALEEARRKAAEEEQRRKLAEQQAAEQRRRQAEEEQRRRAAEQQAAEQRRRQEEAQRQRWQQDQQRQQQQQWQQQQRPHPQTQQQWQQQQPHPQPQWHQPPPPQHPGQQSFAGGRRPASPPGHAPPPPPHGAGAPTSPVNEKYAKMAAQDDDGGQALTITAIKHNILIHWALQPPLLQMLRPIDILITTIHNVFPPAFGVSGHEYFGKWKAVHREALLGPGLRPDEEKLKKSVRKLRFFLHPDKLPRDLNDEQQFMCKMLWDVTSDAWEEFEKHKEELDWIRN